MYTVEEFDKQKTRILKYILYQKRTEQEVRKKFSNDIEEQLLNDIIDYLKETKYINDRDYIKSAINNYIILKNLSIKEIQFKILAKGINRAELEDYISENIDELQEYEVKSARTIINKKSGLKEIDEIKQYLMRKGYNIDNIKKAIEEESYMSE